MPVFIHDAVRTPRGKARADGALAAHKPQDLVAGLVDALDARVGDVRTRAEQLTLVARLLPFATDAAFTFVDLGAGTGAASRAILAEYPRATAILADYSRQMMAEGENSLAKYSGRYRYVELDMSTSEWPDAELPLPLDAAVSAVADSRGAAPLQQVGDAEGVLAQLCAERLVKSVRNVRIVALDQRRLIRALDAFGQMSHQHLGRATRISEGRINALVPQGSQLLKMLVNH